MMSIKDAITIADNAVSTSPDRPGTAIIHDSAEARLVVFAGTIAPRPGSPRMQLAQQ